MRKSVIRHARTGFNFMLPLAIVSAYRLVPGRIRGKIPHYGKGPSSSHLAVRGAWAAYHEGRSAWPSFRDAVALSGGDWNGKN